MAFGKHWEWRGFGAPSESWLERIRGLPLLFDEPQEVVDRYLWSPGCGVNLKLRFGDFKIKRLLRRRPDGLEEWLEDPGENFAFPLDEDVLVEVGAALGVTTERSGAGAVATEEELLERLSAGEGDVRVLAVDKLRWQHRGPEGCAAILEYAEIRAPQQVVSVGVEDESEDKVRATVEALNLDEELRAASYLEALEAWGAGGRVG